MYIITRDKNVIFNISETKNYQENGNVLVNNDTLAIPPSLINKIYEVDEVPKYVKEEKYCYSEEKGFYINEDYVEPETPITQEQITNIELALAELYEMIGSE